MPWSFSCSFCFFLFFPHPKSTSNLQLFWGNFLYETTRPGCSTEAHFAQRDSAESDRLQSKRPYWGRVNDREDVLRRCHKAPADQCFTSDLGANLPADNVDVLTESCRSGTGRLISDACCGKRSVPSSCPGRLRTGGKAKRRADDGTAHVL